MSKVVNCPICGFEIYEGNKFCPNCQQRVMSEKEKPGLKTKKLDQSLLDMRPKGKWGTARFGIERNLLLYINNSPEPLVIKPNKVMNFGRSEDIDAKPDIDLTKFDAYEKGVSRLHATIRFYEDSLSLIDLSSTNGTYLNGIKLIPDAPRLLRDRDEVFFGSLHILFQFD